MYGLYLTNPGTLEWRETPTVSEIKSDEVNIRLICGGICGSDVGVYKGKLQHANYPVVPGHELVGEIIEAGADVKQNIGDRVVIMPNSFCGECSYCKSGKTNICPSKKSLGVNIDGGFQEEFTISSEYILPVPENLPSERAVLTEPLAVIVHAFKKVEITSNTKMAIIGCGAEGMLALSLAYYLGADITVIDLKEAKLAKVEEYYTNVKTALPQDVADSFDIIIEAAGAKQSFEQAIDILNPGGELVVVGMAQQADIPVVKAVRNELTIYGSIIYNFPADFQTSLYYLAQDEFMIEPIVSEQLPVQEYQKAYEHALTGDYGKIIITF